MPVHEYAFPVLSDTIERPQSRVPAERHALGLIVGPLYGLLAHAIFAAASFGPGIMSVGLLLGAPFAIGVIAALSLGRAAAWRSALCGMLACAAVAGLLAAIAMEPPLFLVMATPALLASAAMGAALWQAVRRRGRGAATAFAVCAALAPFGVGAVESTLPRDTAIRNVQTEVAIRADKATIWRNITRVSEIHPEEQRFSMFHALGLPRPRYAVLSRDGVGAIRDATFAGGLSFIETVTGWQREQELRFTIEVDHSKPVPTVIKAIDGVVFTVLEGRYRIVPAGDGRFLLRLDSTQRLSTRFNWYAGFWTDRVMRHLQNYILRIIRDRCERIPS